MAQDNSIRLRQLNQSELSGFVSGVLTSLYQPILPSGNIVPSGSGIFSLGNPSDPYSNGYFNQLNLTSGSGINFGNTPFSAYLSGGQAYLNIGGVTISSDLDGLIYIQGPSGATGLSGVAGPSGATGVGITGISYDTVSHILCFYSSNNTSGTFNFQGLSGSTGVSVTGFYQSGNYIYPQFSDSRGMGAGIELLAGPAGPPGSISLFFQQAGNVGSEFPSGAITINPYYYSTPQPPISLMYGMSYTMDVSGLNTHQMTQNDINLLSQSGLFSGQSLPFSVGSNTNYFEHNGQTGYWRIAFFTGNLATGFYNSISNSAIFVEDNNTQVYGSSLVNNIYRTKISFTSNFTAPSHCKYGVMTYTLGGNDTTHDAILTPTGFCYVLGDVYFSSGIGPVGPQGGIGLSGLQGVPGPVGIGIQGEQGESAVAYNQQQIGPNSFQLQFIFSDGSTGPWVDLPSGGPSGSNGPVGSLSNYFSGIYSNATSYITNSVVTCSGSSYINTGAASIGVDPPNSPWQVLALMGSVGPTGATGYADHYSANFNVASGYPTGAGSYVAGITGISLNGASVSGANSKFTTGDYVAFQNSGLMGLAYTPNQSVIISSNTNTGSYFYGTINSYVSQSGILSFNVNTGLSNLTGILNTTIDSSNRILWNNYGNATINLGQNLMSGAQGIQGIQGIQGPAGAISVMRCSPVYTGNYNTGYNFILTTTGQNITGGFGIDIFDILITGVDTYGSLPEVNITFDWANFNTGQSVIVKVRNSGVTNGNLEPSLFYWDEAIVWPGGISTCPNSSQVYLYTLLRFSDKCYGTYSSPYPSV